MHSVLPRKINLTQEDPIGVFYVLYLITHNPMFGYVSVY